MRPTDDDGFVKNSQNFEYGHFLWSGLSETKPKKIIEIRRKLLIFGK